MPLCALHYRVCTSKGDAMTQDPQDRVLAVGGEKLCEREADPDLFMWDACVMACNGTVDEGRVNVLTGFYGRSRGRIGDRRTDCNRSTTEGTMIVLSPCVRSGKVLL
jgi:hypothetical protein